MSETVSVTTSDDVTIEVPREIVLMWGTVADLLEDYAKPKNKGEEGAEEDGDEGEDEGEDEDASELKMEDIPISAVESGPLEKIIEFCRQYLIDPEGVEWKRSYFASVDDSLEAIQSRNRMLCEITAGANYLNIKPLYKEVTVAISSAFKGKTPEQIRDEWGWPDDLSDERKERIIQENAWCLDL